MLRAALQRGLDVLDRVQVGARYRSNRIGLLQRWYAAQPTQRIIVAVVELQRAVAKPALESAVRALCADHPYALGVCIARDLEELGTRPLTPADAPPLIEPGERGAWELAEQLVHEPFYPGAPLFRVAYADQGKRLVCAFDHIMFDGISAAQFACALAREIAATSQHDTGQRGSAARLDTQPGSAAMPPLAAANPDARIAPSASHQSPSGAATNTNYTLGEQHGSCAVPPPSAATMDARLSLDARDGSSAQPLRTASQDAHLPLDARLDLRPTAAQLVRALRAQPAPVPALPSQAGPLPLRTHISRCEIESMDVNRLRARAHREGVTLHAAISGCALLAAARALDVESRRLRLHTPISLRGRCRPEPRDFGVFIAGVDTDLDVTASTEPWQLARQYAEHLAQAKPDAPGQLGLLALAGDLRERAQKLEQHHHGRTATLEVSNVGRVLDVPDGTKVWLTQGAHYHAPLFVLTLVESASVVRACLSAPHPLIDNERSARFMQAFRAILAQASRN